MIIFKSIPYSYQNMHNIVLSGAQYKKRFLYLYWLPPEKMTNLVNSKIVCTVLEINLCIYNNIPIFLVSHLVLWI